MENVIKLVPESNAEVIDLLEQVLDRARRGEIRGVVIVADALMGDESTYYSNFYSDDRVRLLGFLEYARHSVLNAGTPLQLMGEE